MSKVKSYIEDIEVLYAAGVSDTEISRRLRVPLDLVEEAVTLIDELNYHRDMAKGYGSSYAMV
jgi:hypothetical protein